MTHNTCHKCKQSLKFMPSQIYFFYRGGGSIDAPLTPNYFISHSCTELIVLLSSASSDSSTKCERLNKSKSEAFCHHLHRQTPFCKKLPQSKNLPQNGITTPATKILDETLRCSPSPPPNLKIFWFPGGFQVLKGADPLGGGKSFPRN